MRIDFKESILISEGPYYRKGSFRKNLTSKLYNNIKKPLTFCDKYIDKAIEQYYLPQTYPPNKWNIPLYQRLKHHLLRK